MTELSSAQQEAVEAALAQLDLETKVAMLSGKDLWSLPPVPAIGLASIVMSDGPVGVRGTEWSAEDPSIALPSPTALAATWDPALAKEAGRLLGQEARRKGVHVLLAPTVNLHRSPLGGRHFECYSEDPLLTAEIGIGYVKGVQEHGVATTVKHFVANDFETERFTASAQVSDRALRELYLAPFEAIVHKASAWGVMSAYNAVNGVSMTDNAELQRGVLKGEWGFDGVIVSDWLAARDTVATANGGLDIAMPAFASPWGDKLVAAVRNGEVAVDVIDEQVRRVLRLAARVGALAGAPESVPPASRPPAVDGQEMAREIARRAFVLAANPGGILPLDASALSSVAVIGALAKDARVLGGGSATVFPEHVISPLAGLTAALPDRAALSYAFGADPRTGKLAPAMPPQWSGLRARFADATGATRYETTLATGRARWMHMPEGVDPEAIASVEITGRLTAEVGGQHQLAIRGLGKFTLTAGDQTLFDGAVQPDSDDIATSFLSPPEQRAALALAAGDSADVSLRQPVSLARGSAVISLSLGYAPPMAAPDDLLAEAEQVARDADVAIVVVGTTEEVESEGFDRTTLALPGRQDELVRRVAAANPRTIVVVNAGSPVELPWADDVAAVLLAWFPGQEAGHALADVLLGVAEPGGRLPTTWPVREADCPVLSTTPAGGLLPYEEGVFIGYRAWERRVREVVPPASTAERSARTDSPRSGADRTAVAPRYPFGHGLGYTTWEYERLTADHGSVTVTVRNTGSRTGREVVQIYAAPLAADEAHDKPQESRPRRWLAGFASVIASPGESATAVIDLPERTWQVWAGGWRTISGEYRIEAAHSLADTRLEATVTIA